MSADQAHDAEQEHYQDDFLNETIAETEVDPTLRLRTTSMGVFTDDGIPIVHAVEVSPDCWHIAIGAVGPGSWDESQDNVTQVMTDGHDQTHAMEIVQDALYHAWKAVADYQDEVAEAEQRLSNQISGIPQKL